MVGGMTAAGIVVNVYRDEKQCCLYAEAHRVTDSSGESRCLSDSTRGQKCSSSATANKHVFIAQQAQVPAAHSEALFVLVDSAWQVAWPDPLDGKQYDVHGSGAQDDKFLRDDA